MASTLGTAATHDELIRVIRRVRNRWRMRVALRGAAIVLAAGLLAILISAYGMEHFRFSAPSVVAFRIFAYVALLGLTVRFLMLPLSRQVSDERVALYIEEHEPSSEAVILSAVEEAGARGAGRGARRSGLGTRDSGLGPATPESRVPSPESRYLTLRS